MSGLAGDDCLGVRAEALDGRADAAPSRSAAAHLAACAPCRAALAARTRVANALSALARRPVPAELDTRVHARPWLEPEAESAAEQRLDSSAEPLAELFGRLQRQRAPLVLDQLVREEIADPARARARRFAGDLERLSAPAALNLAAVVHGPGRARRPLLRFAAAAAVAGLLFSVWLAQRENLQPAPAARYRFQVVRATEVAQLDPMARGLVDGLTGGMLSAARERQPDPRGVPR
jgi:hypothetical protein